MPTLQEKSPPAEKTESKPLPKPTKIRRTFTPQQKAKVVAYIKIHGAPKASRHFKIFESVIRRWARDAKVEKGIAPRYTDDFKARVVAYAREHTAVAASKKFGPHNSAIYNWIKQVEGRAPHTKNNPERRTPGQLYLLARKLAAEVSKQLRATGELNSLLVYADMLVKEILK